MRLTIHDYAMIHGVGILSRSPLDRGRENDAAIRRALAGVMPGVNRKAPELAMVVSVGDMLAAGTGEPLGLSDIAARALLDWDRVRLAMALDVIGGRS